ncbi:MAG: SDR family NAD(P)-dependent oxidoreductase, partial [Lachnospiraceae bacterium]|nr:SDR family NAD(P)-dependent oxidoreductase [Lachnospiraceae bacterium]
MDVKKAFSLEGRVALITGAVYGIGFAIAEAYAAAGAKICFNCLSEEQRDKALEDYRAKGIDAHGYVADCTKEDEVQEMIARIEEEVGVVDILVNNAGIIKRIPMHEMKRAEFQQVIDVDLVAPYICAAAVVPEMMERREGKIINVCSMMSELGRETVSAYAAAKGG